MIASRHIRRIGFLSAAIVAALLFATPGSRARCIAVGDLNGDGAPDVVTINSSANSLSVWINKHNGTVAFDSPVTYATGTGPTSVAIADLNGDSKLDVVACNGTAGTISVFLGNGDGTLGSAATYSVLPPGVSGTQSPSSLEVGDIRGKGIPDIVVSNFEASTVSVLQGDGKGAFSAIASYPVGKKPTSVALARLTTSGHLDVATANTNGRSISVLLGKGDGTFLAAKTTAAGYVPYALVARDFDGDGVADIAVCDNMSLASGVNLLKGNGDGTFHPAVLFPGGPSPIAMASGDFNNDGRPDLATVNSGSLDVSIFLNDGIGGFAAPITAAEGVNHIGVAVGDIDGDGNLELILANTPSGITVEPATAPTVKQLSLSPATVLTGGTSIGTVVLNRVATGSGVSVQLSTDRGDLVALPATVLIPSGSISSTFSVNSISPVTGTARIRATPGSLTAYADLTVNPVPPAPLKGDMNNDGKLDVVDLSILARIALGIDPAQ